MSNLVYCCLLWSKIPTWPQKHPLQPWPLMFSQTQSIQLSDVNIDPMTQAWGTGNLPAKVEQKRCGSLRFKVNTGTGGNLMPLCVFDKLFHRCITATGRPTGLSPCNNSLTAYNGSNIPHLGVLDTAMEWLPKGHKHSRHLHIQWYVADSPGAAILLL